MWRAVQALRASEAPESQVASLEWSASLVLRLLRSLGVEADALEVSQQGFRLSWAIEAEAYITDGQALDSEWVVRRVCPSAEPEIVVHVWREGPLRFAWDEPGFPVPAAGEDDVDDVLAELLRTDEQVMAEVLLNAGPPLSDLMISTAVREADARLTSAVDAATYVRLAALMVHRLLMGAGSRSPVHHVWFDGDMRVESVQRIGTAGIPPEGDETQFAAAMVDEFIESLPSLRGTLAQLLAPVHGWVVMSGVFEVEYPKPLPSTRQT